MLALRSIALLALAMGAAAPATASSPMIWNGVSSVGVLCLVQGPAPREREKLETALCEAVKASAAGGAPVKVTRLHPGDPALLAPGAVSLLVHASVDTVGSERLLAFTIRPYRVSGAQDDVLFGSALRVARVPADSIGSTFTAEVANALKELLPWKAAEARTRVQAN